MKKAFGHVVFPYNFCTKNIFLKSKTSTCYIVSKDGIVSSPQYISTEIINFLKLYKYEITPVSKTYMNGINRLCEIDISVKKIADYGAVRQLLITVDGNHQEIDDKIKTIQKHVKEKCGILSDERTFTKLDGC